MRGSVASSLARRKSAELALKLKFSLFISPINTDWKQKMDVNSHSRQALPRTCHVWSCLGMVCFVSDSQAELGMAIAEFPRPSLFTRKCAPDSRPCPAREVWRRESCKWQEARDDGVMGCWSQRHGIMHDCIGLITGVIDWECNWGCNIVTGQRILRSKLPFVTPPRIGLEMVLWPNIDSLAIRMLSSRELPSL